MKKHILIYLGCKNEKTGQVGWTISEQNFLISDCYLSFLLLSQCDLLSWDADKEAEG
jgi:hypothetical protein